MSGFVHLHVHSHYSLLDGAATVKALVEAAVKNRMSALALTDHGNMFGAIDFYQACMAAGIKPIVGYEAYVAPRSRLDKSARENESTSHHLTLLVRDMEGYRNLIKLASEAYLTGFYYKPRIDDELLRRHSGGLIALSGCMKSQLSACIMRDDADAAEAAARKYSDIFGEGNFYLELQDHGIPEQKKVYAGTVETAKRTGLPLVATNDLHYIERADWEAQDALICINTGKLLSDVKRMKMTTEQLYFKSEREMAAIAGEHAEALSNTLEIASRCNLELDFDTLHFPVFDPPEGKTVEDYFEGLCWKGLSERIDNPDETYKERLRFEINSLKKIGLAAYMLIVWDFISFARKNDIPVGPGRGSACGSLAAFCLRIVDTDPIKYNILFERFADVNRREMPDIDTDFCIHGREKVIEYVREKYGSDNVAQIITFGTMAARGAVRDVGRVLDIPLSQVDAIAKKIPFGSTISEALKSEPEFTRLAAHDPKIKKLFTISRKLEGLNRHSSTHAAGVVMADKPLTEYIPLYKSGSDITSQYPMKPLEDVGLVKMDFLGLRTLTQIEMATETIGRNHKIDFDISSIPLDDTKTFELIQRGETKGVFQLESAGFREMLMRLKPDCLEDVIATVALYRPGPLGSGVVDDFIDRKHGRKKVKYLHPLMEAPLKESYGVMIYQGQIMQIAHRMAGFSMADALTLIKAIGKKKTDFIEGNREKFVKGCVSNDVPKRIAEKIFEQIVYFGGYGFNKGHSTAYGILAYRTAFLKANYPVEFMAALLTTESGNIDKVVDYIAECERMGIEALPPNVNTGHAGFTARDGKIHFGLYAIKGVGGKAAEAIAAGREKAGSFDGIFHFCENVDLRAVNKAAIEALVKSGAFDWTGWSRAQLLASIDGAVLGGGRTQDDRRSGQMNFLVDFQQQRSQNNGLNPPDVPEWPEPIKLKYEKETLGFYVSSHPLAKHKEDLKHFSSACIAELKAQGEGAEILIGCMLHNIKSKITRAGKKMAQLDAEDLTGSCRAIVFPANLEKCAQFLKEDQPVFVTAKLDKRTEEPCLLISEIVPLHRMYSRMARNVVVSAPLDSIDEKRLESLRALIAEHPGKCPVFIDFGNGSGRITMRVSRRFYVSASRELIEGIDKLLGADAVVVR